MRHYGLLRGACHRARLRATRWLAMTFGGYLLTLAHIVAPSTHGANSAPPKSKLSLLVGWPDAVFSISSKIRWPHCCTLSSPSRMVPQLTSMSSSMRLYIAVLVASLIEGAGLQPNTLPRPVVKQTRLAPPATCPVAATGS